MDEEIKKWLGTNEPIPSEYKIPFFIHEQDMCRISAENKRESLWKNIIIILLILLLVVTNGYWIYKTSQYEVVETTVTQDVDAGDGDAIINDGVHIDGEDTADSES